MLSNSAQPIAIEFGVGSLKALQVAGGEKPSLIAAACLDTPEELYQDHATRLQFQLDGLPRLLKGAGFHGRRTICSIPASQTLVQHMQIPKVDGVSVASQIANELQINMGISPSRVVIRHMTVSDAAAGSSSTREVICIAIARDVVLRIIQGLRASRLDTVGVHSEHLALVHAFDSFCRSDEDKASSLYLDIGVGTTKAVIAHGSDLVFAKTIDIAGLAIDQCVAKQLKCEPSEARSRRLALMSLTPDSSGGRPSGGGAPDRAATSAGETAPQSQQEAVAVLDEQLIDQDGGGEPGRGPIEIDGRRVDLSEPLDALTDEIAMCLRYHARLFPGRGIDRAIFVGGEARHVGLCRHVARTLRLPARVADPLPHLVRSQSRKFKNLDVTKPQPGWTAAYGLTVCPADL